MQQICGDGSEIYSLFIAKCRFIFEAVHVYIKNGKSPEFYFLTVNDDYKNNSNCYVSI